MFDNVIKIFWYFELIRDIESRIKSRSVRYLRYVGAGDFCRVGYHVCDATKNNVGKSEPGDVEEFEG